MEVMEQIATANASKFDEANQLHTTHACQSTCKMTRLSTCAQAKGADFS